MLIKKGQFTKMFHLHYLIESLKQPSEVDVIIPNRHIQVKRVITKNMWRILKRRDRSQMRHLKSDMQILKINRTGVKKKGEKGNKHRDRF